MRDGMDEQDQRVLRLVCALAQDYGGTSRQLRNAARTVMVSYSDVLLVASHIL